MQGPNGLEFFLHVLSPLTERTPLTKIFDLEKLERKEMFQLLV